MKTKIILKSNNNQIIITSKLRNLSLANTIRGVMHQMIRVINRMIVVMHYMIGVNNVKLKMIRNRIKIYRYQN